MAFTSVTLIGTVELEPGVPAPSALVSMTLSGAMTDGSTAVEPYLTSVRCGVDGTFSMLTLANDDMTTSPSGTYYNVSVTCGVRVTDAFAVTVPASVAPIANLFSLPRK